MTGVAPEPLQPRWRFLAGFDLVDNKRLYRLGLGMCDTIKPGHANQSHSDFDWHSACRRSIFRGHA
jgi:hypothetical protein